MNKILEKLNDYDGFVEKFKPKKTTDDCYTPTAVYEAVLGWAKERYGIEEDIPIVRPFWPGCDYEHFDYPEGCIVIDNPPFSIYTKIVRFYLEHKIRFLLFAPALTQLVFNADCCYLCTSCNITYENGAIVRTGFTTNLEKGTRMWTCPELRERVKKACTQTKPKKTVQKIVFPDHLITSATVLRISERGVDLRIRDEDAIYVRSVNEKKIFGAGLVLSERAAAERAAAELVNVIVLQVPSFKQYVSDRGRDRGGVIF